MKSVTLQEPMYEFMEKRIELRSKWMIGRCGIKSSDFDEIQGELWARILSRLNNFDAGKANFQTFISRQVKWHSIMILRQRRAKSRTYLKEACSLNEVVRGKEIGMVSRSETVSSEKYAHSLGRPSTTPKCEDKKIDVDAVIQKLPQEYQRICECLKTNSYTDAIKILNIKRRALDHAIGEIRKVFELYDC